MDTTQEPSTMACAFCGKSKDDVRDLIVSDARSDIAICDECVRLSYEIVSHVDLQPQR